MKRMFRLLPLSLSTLAACLTFGATASAQGSVAEKLEARITAAADKLQGACGADVQKYCSTVSPGEGRLLFCILAHEDKISTKCDYGLFKAAKALSEVVDRIEETEEACSGGIDKYCMNVQPGEGQIAQCLKKNEKSLKKACRAALQKWPVMR
jgi:hypothetical protein